MGVKQYPPLILVIFIYISLLNKIITTCVKAICVPINKIIFFIYNKFEYKESNMKIKDNVALVTGGASGLGRAAVEHIVTKGGKAAIVDINEEKANDELANLVAKT